MSPEEIAAQAYRKQKSIVRIWYWVFKPIAFFTRRIDWVVGPTDVALMASHIAAALPRSYTAVITRNRFYPQARYDAVVVRASDAPETDREEWRRLHGGAVLLAWLAARARGFIYVGGEGFLDHQYDEREFEFAFLKRHRKKIICYFTGTDIRSPRLMADLAEETGLRNVGTELVISNPRCATPKFDESRKLRAKVAETYSDIIFTSRVDQLSYLTVETEPFRYFYPDEQFLKSTNKFDRPEKIIIVHAPSNPVIKGTDHVREAISILKTERDDFEYRELFGVDNEVVLAALDEAHIALNQFYAFIPGVFGVEAMARRCVLVTSADEFLETDLPSGSNNAWVMTRVETILDNLRSLLDNREGLEAQAEAGWQWAWDNASISSSAVHFANVLKKHGLT